jgi:RNA polymerase sigma factor (sigma-70 family)
VAKSPGRGPRRCRCQDRNREPGTVTSTVTTPLAEDLTQEALLAALQRWPGTGVPEKAGAWLMATAKRRASDHLRRRRMRERKHEMVAQEMDEEQQAMPDLDSALDDDIGDELLRLIFTACHPLLSREARATLALRMICGLTTEEIARAFLLPDATIALRITRGSGLFRNRGWPTRPRAARSSRNGSLQCLKSSTSFSTKATPRRAAESGNVPSSVMRRCAWAACSPPSRRTSPKPTDCSP